MPPHPAFDDPRRWGLLFWNWEGFETQTILRVLGKTTTSMTGNIVRNWVAPVSGTDARVLAIHLQSTHAPRLTTYTLSLRTAAQVPAAWAVSGRLVPGGMATFRSALQLATFLNQNFETLERLNR
jgi:hypothetical protein